MVVALDATLQHVLLQLQKELVARQLLAQRVRLGTVEFHLQPQRVGWANWEGTMRANDKCKRTL